MLNTHSMVFNKKYIILMFNMGIFCSCSKLQENENNLVCNTNSDINILIPLNVII